MQPPNDSHVAIEAMYSSWISAFERADVDAILELLTPDYTLWAPGAPPMAGRDALRPILEAALAVYNVAPSFELEERMISGNLAVDIGWDVQAVRPKHGGPER
ncbi:MAG: nuclear transport factor 2 family protein, partial [Gemmatimonadaceae bacterium]